MYICCAIGRSAVYRSFSSLCLFFLSCYDRGNPIADLDEVAKLKCLPLIRALILVGTYAAAEGEVTVKWLPYPPLFVCCICVFAFVCVGVHICLCECVSRYVCVCVWFLCVLILLSNHLRTHMYLKKLECS